MKNWRLGGGSGSLTERSSISQEERRERLAIIPSQHRVKTLFLQDNTSRVLGGYLRGQLTLALIIGILAGVGTALLGLPYAVVLGVLAGLFELVPMFGPILSVVAAVLVALFMPFPTVVWVVLLYLVIQQVENNVLAPRISGHAVGLHPLGAMFALLAGFQLAGLLGALFAVPLAGVLWVLLGAAYRNVVVAEPPGPSDGYCRCRASACLPARSSAESTVSQPFTGRAGPGRGARVLSRSAVVPGHIWTVGVHYAVEQFLTRGAPQRLVARAQTLQVILRELLQVEKGIVRPADRADQFIEFEVHCGAIAVLRVLDEKHHQECDDRSARIDHQLPGVAESKYRSGDEPDDDRGRGEHKRQRVTRGMRRPFREAREW